MTTDTVRRAYRKTEVARMLGVHHSTISRWVDAGTLPSIRIGDTDFIPARAVDDLFPTKTSAGGDAA